MLIDINLIIKIKKIGRMVQIISNFWFSKIFLLLNLFIKLNFNIIIKIIDTLIIIIIRKLCNIIILRRLIEFGFWKFKFIQVIIYFLM